MNKKFNLSIPKKRLRTARFKLGQYYSKLVTFFSSAALSGTTLSLVLAGALILPQTVQAADENVDNDPPGCIIERGTITTSPQSATFAAGSTDADIDFKITCTGALHAHLDKGSIEALFVKRAAETKADNNTAAYDPEESITMIDLSEVTGNGLSFALDPATAILKGMLTNGDSITDGAAVWAYTEADDTHNINVENRADITVKGLGRRAISVYRDEDQIGRGDVTVKNFGSITTEGGPCDRTDSESTCFRGADNPNPHRRALGLQAGIDNAGATGHVMVTNEPGAEIHVMGDGARGIEAYNSGTGDTTVNNVGMVKTEGALWVAVEDNPDTPKDEEKSYSPRGISVWANSGTATVTNSVGGEVTTGVDGDASKGQRGYGVAAFTGDDDVPDSGDATATNLGTITTYGPHAHGLRASTYAIAPGSSSVTNSGDITTKGEYAHGMSSWAGNQDSANRVSTEGNNSAMITTHGDNAAGASIYAASSSDPTSSASFRNSGAGKIRTHGADAYGIGAGFYMDRATMTDLNYSGDALGDVYVENKGSVETTGDADEDSFIAGISSGYWANDEDKDDNGDPDNVIENSGDAEILHQGKVTASGHRSAGLLALTYGSGDVRINVERDVENPENAIEITAGKQGENFGVGIAAIANTASANSRDDPDIDVTIRIEGQDSNEIEIRAEGAASDDESTDDYDESKGIAILADSGGEYNDEGAYRGTGESSVDIIEANVAGVSGAGDSGYSVMFKGGGGTLTVVNSHLYGDIAFTDDDDILNISGHQDSTSTIQGNIDFGGASPVADDDQMNINITNFYFGNNISGYPHLTKSVPGILSFTDANIQANRIDLSSGDDILNFRNEERSGLIEGDIDFGGGDDDQLNIVVGSNFYIDLMGDIRGLETMSKEGAGIARINNVEFTGSTLNLEEGQLIVAGHLDLGTASGELIIEDSGKLVFEIGDVSADSHSDQTPNHGKLTVGTLTFRSTDAGNHEVFVQLNKDLDDDQVEDVQAELGDSEFPLALNLMTVGSVQSGAAEEVALLTDSTLLVQSESDGTKTQVGSVMVGAGGAVSAGATFESDMVGMITKLVLPEAMMETPVGPTDPTDNGGSGMTPDSDGDGMTSDPDGGDSAGGSDGGDSADSGGMTATSGGSSSNDGGAILGVGLLAVLMSSFMADEDASASFGDYYFNTPQSAYIAQANERGVMTIKETGNQPYQMWIRTGHTAQPMRMTGVSNTGVSGTEVGVNLYNSDTFYINTSVAPNVAAEVGSLNLAAKGEVYSLSSGWRNDRYFGGLRLSHGEFEVNSIVDNPIVNSALISNAKLRNTQAQLRAGMNLGTGALRFTPSASIQVGTYENSEHVAESPALEATIPSYTQDYTSVQLGLKMTSEKWLSFTNGSKWKPQLKFDSIHTDSKDTGSLTLRQSDKAGALSFNTNAGLRSMPDVVNSMSFGAKVKSSANDQAEWKFGFAGLEADGEEYYAAMAAYQLKF